MQRNLQDTLQALYDSEIKVSITMLWDGGFDFCLCSYMDPEYDDMTSDVWHHVGTAAELADALHNAAMKECPDSTYAKSHSRPALKLVDGTPHELARSHDELRAAVILAGSEIRKLNYLREDSPVFRKLRAVLRDGRLVRKMIATA